ncbi:hypothetical protein GTP58_03780 [Duganella sp. CY15W]|uniref:hypothetical protein n=1 Tax=Duganella sp. CY15W TaxID=2692172 RepID=UPI00136E72F5|nr:hypothetical protein [Duganella sp. CY15W]MYM27436.1 hypothetical protein [Duganella sp. CY15W]
MKNCVQFMSWLKYLDVEYIDGTKWESLTKLDINDPKHWSQIIDLAMREDVASLNAISKQAMKAVLDDLEDFSEREVKDLMDRICMPFETPMHDYAAFFRIVRQEFFGSN